MAELGASQYIGRLTNSISPASSIGALASSRGFFYVRDSSSIADGGDYGESDSLISRPTIPLPRAVSAQLITYRMRGLDVDCATLTYRYWYAVGAPDYSASLYTGPKCGASALAAITVVDNVAP
jgi:hypothetical protein